MVDIIQEFLKLRENMPRSGLYQVVNQNSAFTNYTDGLKNCYLVTNAFNSEDMFYGRNLAYNRDCIDCDHSYHCELCYQCVDCVRCYNGSFLQDCEDSNDCIFGYDLKGCSNCFGCVALRRKSFCIFNEPYSKEDYFEKLKSLKSADSPARFEELKKTTPRKFANIIQTEHAVGDYIENSKNCFYSFDTQNSEDCMYCYEIKESTDCMDVTIGEFMVGNYECHSAWKLQNSKFCTHCWESTDLEYCDQVFRSRDCFFSVYLNHKEYMILNKPYPKKEYFKEVAAYKDQLRASNLYGRWFIPTAYKSEDTCVSMEKM